MKANGYVYAILGSLLLTTAQASIAAGYRCEGYCAGIDYKTQSFYDAGYIWTEDPSSQPLTYQRLREKCRQTLLHSGIDLSPTLVKSIEGSRAQVDEHSSSSSYSNGGSTTVTTDGYYIYNGYYYYTVWPRERTVTYSNQNSSSQSRYDHHELKTSIKVEQLFSKDSCSYDQSIQVPSYDGFDPAQG